APIARSGVRLAEIRNHDLACSVEISPLIGVRKRRNGDALAAVEARERGIDEVIGLPYNRQAIDILVGFFPKPRPHGPRQHGLDIDALGPEFCVKTLAQEEEESFRRAINGGTVFWNQPDN